MEDSVQEMKHPSKLPDFKLEQTDTFEKGNMICHSNNLLMNFPVFVEASQEEVDNYSGKNGIYYRIVKI